MNVISKDVVAAAGFDAVAWREELLALNPWARGLTIDEANAQFAEARQKATLARHAKGKEEWNDWASSMIELRAALKAAGQWTAKRYYSKHKEYAHAVEVESNFYAYLTGENEATRTWLALASAVFKHRFDAEVSFVSFVFPTDARFDGATFCGGAWFASATFSQWAWFDRASFSGGASFSGATFSGPAFFTTASFRDWAQFGGASFSSTTKFTGATFSGEADFKGATFSSRTFLDRIQFNAETDFQQAKFNEPVTFADSIFRQGANLDNIDSGATFSLADAVFKQVPGFFGAAFKGTLRLDNVATPRYPWLGYTPDKDSTARFRELRRRAVEAQDHERELEFFAQEVRTRRFHAKGLPSWVPKVWSWRFWFGLGFGALSDFGRSLWRPLLSWLALTVLCAAFFLGEHDDMRKARAALAPSGFFGTVTAYVATTRDALANPPACLVQGRKPFASTNAVTEAFLLSLKNALVLNIGSTDSARRALGCLYGPEQDGDQQYVSVPTFVSVVSTAQALASGLLIFLFVLAVRNLLRLK